MVIKTIKYIIGFKMLLVMPSTNKYKVKINNEQPVVSIMYTCGNG